MVSRLPALPQAIAACLILLISSPAQAAEAGAWETFSTEDNAAAWLSYDYNDDPEIGGYYTVIFDDQTDPSDPYALSSSLGDVPIDFSTFTDLNAGEGKLLGNYATQSIQGILLDFYIDSLPNFFVIYPAIYVNNPGGGRSVYYGLPYYYVDLATSGWHQLRFGFDEPWSHQVGANFVEEVPGDQFFTAVDEISFIIVPAEGSSGTHYWGIDNVKLEPKVTKPAITTATTGGNFSMTFTPGTGVTCTVEKQDPWPLFGWTVIPEAFDITGTTPFTYSVPIDPTLHSEVFRVSYDPIYTPFTTPPVVPP